MFFLAERRFYISAFCYQLIALSFLFRTIYVSLLLCIHTREQRELLEQRICNFYCHADNKSVKATGNYFKKQNTVYYILKKYLRYGTTKDLSRSGRPVKLSTKDFNRLVKSVNNRCVRSQRKLGRRFRVHQSTISRNLRHRTSVIIRKRKKAPKMDSEEQQRRARKNCAKLYRKLLNDEDLIIDDEKFFKFSGNNVLGKRYFYSTDPSAAPPNIRFQQKTKFESKVMVWMAISAKGVSNVYVHRGKQPVDIWKNVSIDDDYHLLTNIILTEIFSSVLI